MFSATDLILLKKIKLTAFEDYELPNTRTTQCFCYVNNFPTRLYILHMDKFKMFLKIEKAVQSWTSEM